MKWSARTPDDVHHVVRDQLVIALNVDLLGLRERPFAVRGPPPVRDERRIGTLGRAHPDPQPLVALNEWIGAHARLRRNARLAGNLDAAPVRRKQQAVIAAAQPIALELAHRQRQMPVTAAVFQRYCGTVLAAVEHDRLIEQRARERLARHLGCAGGDVPGLAQEFQMALACTTSVCASHLNGSEPPTLASASATFSTTSSSLTPRLSNNAARGVPRT
jgi:hypothetical protein